MRTVIVVLMALLATGQMQADNRQARKHIRTGNRLYSLGQRQQAQVAYLKALGADSTDARAHYNLATAMFPDDWKAVKQEQVDTMVQTLSKAAQLEENPFRKSQAYRNIGVLYQGARQFKQAIEAYKNALRNNPNDDEARYNLVLCQRQLKDDQNQQGQNQQGQNQQKQDQQQQQQDQQKQEQQQKKQQQDEQQQQEEQQEPPMSKENAEQLLNAAMQQEKKTQERMQQQQQAPRRRLEKNW